MKKIGYGSFTFVSQARIAMENLGKSQQYVCTLTKELRDAGWMTVIRRGQGRSNINILHAFKGQKTTNEEVKFYKQEVSKIGASSVNCCYLIKYAEQIIIFKQVKHILMTRNMSNDV